jgi:molybdenum cofactor cytidylyltransferase
MEYGGIILAAGAGRRFGGPKQLAELRGRPLLEHAVEAMCCVPAIERIVVVLGSHAAEILERVEFFDAEPIVCEDWSEGMSASLRCGLDALAPDAPDAVMITLGDQPRITPQVIAMVLDPGGRAPAVRATYGGVPGHPVLVRRRLIGRLRELRGDRGAREVLAGVKVANLEAGHLCRPDDVDTPEQLEAIRT